MSDPSTYIVGSAAQQWAVAPTTPDSIIISGKNGQPIVTIHPDGRLEYGVDYTPDTAARTFWDALEKLARLHQFGPALDATINAHLAAGQAAERKVERLDQMATAWLERLPDTIRTATAVEAVHHITRDGA